jgi:pimeloyl-ACP methyl ester carboxylesterase
MQLIRLAFAGVRCLPCGLQRSVPLAAATAIVFAFAPPTSADAQDKKAAGKNEKAATTEKLDEDLVLRTRDGLQLAITYYPPASSEELQQGKGKKTIPIVLLHDWKEKRTVYRDLAHYLQKQGYAVIVPDLRGHGESTRRRGTTREDTIDAVKMRPNQFGLMVAQDMRAVKDFLWKRNNEGELNIDKLCVVGADMGASVALNFALLDAADQERNVVQRPDYKLGCFVKALVLISPQLSFKGLPVQKAANYPAVQRDISIMILVGSQNAKAMAEAKRIHSMFERSHPEPTGEDRLDRQTLFLGELDTNLEGTKLLDPKFNLSAVIADFINRRLVKADAAKNWGWRERKYPYE